MSTPGTNPPPPDPAAVDPTVLDLLRGSALAPMLDQPVGDILHGLGLPPLPQLPAGAPVPGLPPVPLPDPAALMRPLTDLASAFGTGRFGGGAPPADEPAAGGPVAEGGGAPPAQPVGLPGMPQDPTQMLSGITQTLSTVMQLAPSALQTVMSVWQGMAAMQANQKAGEAQNNSAELANQSAGQKTVLTGAAGSVAQGAGLMPGVVTKQSTLMALAPLLAPTGGGAAFLVGSTIQSISEALGITAETKMQLLGHSATMSKVGTKVKVTKPPTGVKGGGTQDVGQLMSMISPLLGAAGTATQAGQQIGQLTQAHTNLGSPSSIADEKSGADPHDTLTPASGELGSGELGGGGLGGGLDGAGGGLGGPGATPTPLAPWSGTQAAGLGGAAGSAPGAGGGNGSYMPMGGGGGAAGAGRAGDGGVDDATRANLVTGQHGDEVVGRIEGVSLPVVGAPEQVSEPPPDKDLSL